MRLPGGYETHPLADVFPKLEGAELAPIVESMKTRGFDESEPIILVVVREKGKDREYVLDGRNRLCAADRAGVKLARKHFSRHRMRDDGTAEGLGNVVAYVIGRNIARRHLSESQRADVAARLATLRPGSNQKQVKGKPAKAAEAGPANLRNLPPVATAEAAKLLSVSPRLVEHARVVHEKAAPEVQRAVQEGRISVSAASQLAKRPPAEQKAIAERVTKKKPAEGESGEIRAKEVRGFVRQAERAEVTKKLEEEKPALPAGPFRVIVSDPPWPYEARADDPTQRAQMPYPPMSIEAICGLDVVSFVHPEGCVLWLWTTNAFMRDAYRVLDAWGFEEKTILTWVKEKLGAGHYLRNTTEHCILAVRGKAVINGSSERTDLRGELREHSRKPETFYELVERACPGSKVEMFSRTPRPGWGAWGAEVGKFEADPQRRLVG